VIGAHGEFNEVPPVTRRTLIFRLAYPFYSSDPSKPSSLADTTVCKSGRLELGDVGVSRQLLRFLRLALVAHPLLSNTTYARGTVFTKKLSSPPLEGRSRLVTPSLWQPKP